MLEKYSPKEQTPSLDNVPVESSRDKPIETRERKERFWHATYTGRDGNIVDGILRQGLLPKSALNDPSVGNRYTYDKDATYITKLGKDALFYLKSALEYPKEDAGLPVLVVVDAPDKDTSYSYDTDLVTGITGEVEDRIQRDMWVTLISTYETIDDFLLEPMPSATGKDLQKLLEPLRGRSTKDSMAEIKTLIDSAPYAGFLEGQRLDKYLKIVDPKRWNAFLQKTTNTPGSKVSLTRRLKKKGGFTPDTIERLYVISPGGDPDWRKWCHLIPGAIANQWDTWKGSRALDGSIIPENGRLVRIT